MSGAVYSKVLGCDINNYESLRLALIEPRSLMSAFHWKSSKLGGDYWANQYYGLSPEGRSIIESALAEIEPPKPPTSRRAIVARMQNGKPAPALNPHVHADTESAREEAARLATLNVGAEFAVLEIVSISKATASVTTEAA